MKEKKDLDANNLATESQTCPITGRNSPVPTVLSTLNSASETNTLIDNEILPTDVSMQNGTFPPREGNITKKKWTSKLSTLNSVSATNTRCNNEIPPTDISLENRTFAPREGKTTKKKWTSKLSTLNSASATNTRSDNEIPPTYISMQNGTCPPGVGKITKKKWTSKRVGTNKAKTSSVEDEANIVALTLNDNHLSLVSPGAVSVPGTNCDSSLGARPNNNALDDASEELFDESQVADRDPSIVIDAQVVTQHYDEEHATVAAKVVHPTPIIKQFFRKRPYALLLIVLCIFGTILGVIISLWLKRTSPPTPIPSTGSTAPPNPTGYDETQRSIMNILQGHPNLTIDEDPSSGTPQSFALEWLLSTNSSSLMENGYLSDTDIFERYGLAVLFYSTNGSSWKEQANFLTESTSCSWNRPLSFPYGVFCDNNAQVNEIRLSQSNLSGTIPSELSLLSNLQLLYLDANTLENVIPTELGRLTAMRVLSIQSNLLFGPLPTEFGTLVALEILSLGDNKVTGTIPTELGRLTNLQVLEVYGNDISGLLPTELGLMTSLTNISTDGNSFQGTLPMELGRLTNLQFLSVASHVLTSNGFIGPLPTELGLITSLISIFAGSNSFTGTLPTELGRLANLQFLSLTSNGLTGPLPTELGFMTSLTGISADYNFFTGTLPTELGQLTALESLDVNFNYLSGTIPSELASNSNVQVVFDPQKSP